MGEGEWARGEKNTLEAYQKETFLGGRNQNWQQ